jgi:hypothetical protein
MLRADRPDPSLRSGGVIRMTTNFCYPNRVVRMIWWFLTLGVSTLVVVCVAIALLVHLRRNLHKVAHEEAPSELSQPTKPMEL